MSNLLISTYVSTLDVAKADISKYLVSKNTILDKILTFIYIITPITSWDINNFDFEISRFDKFQVFSSHPIGNMNPTGKQRKSMIMLSSVVRVYN